MLRSEPAFAGASTESRRPRQRRNGHGCSEFRREVRRNLARRSTDEDLQGLQVPRRRRYGQPVSIRAYALLVVVAAAVAIAAVVLLAALLTLIALAVPARQNGSLRAELQAAGVERTRRGAWTAFRVWRGAYLSTGHGGRRIVVLLGFVTTPLVLASARWRRRSVLLTAPGACARVVRRRGGGWALLDVAGWPVGARRARPLLRSICSAADAGGVTTTLRASSPEVVLAVYAPLGFQRVHGRAMIRPPQVSSQTDVARLEAIGR